MVNAAYAVTLQRFPPFPTFLSMMNDLKAVSASQDIETFAQKVHGRISVVQRSCLDARLDSLRTVVKGTH